MDASAHAVRSEDRPGASRGAQLEVIRATDPVTIVVFGATGDLSRRKIFPALYQLRKAGLLPDRHAIVGCASTPLNDDAFRDQTRQALNEFVGGGAIPESEPMIRGLSYLGGNFLETAFYAALKEKLEALEKAQGLPGNRLYYLAIAPSIFPAVIKLLATSGLTPRKAGSWHRVIIEKPFGRDLASARALNAEVNTHLRESQIYRIDHYLGKETVQNILAFRLGNSIWEPLFNRRYVDHVQITVAETVGMEGRRGGYYDTAGALRDIVQNHMLQLLSLTAMEPPAAMDAQSIRDEKVKVLRALEPIPPDRAASWTVRGQYRAGKLGGEPVSGYRDEAGVSPASTTETYVALRLHIDNWRWAGVPFLLRTGKRLARRASEIAVQFKQPPLRFFAEMHDGGVAPHPRSNVLVFRIQPDEGISLWFAAKAPGMRVLLEEVRMDFLYGAAFRERLPEAYERLRLDALRGDASLFTRSDEVEYAWTFASSVLDGWGRLPPPALPNYDPGSDGPDEAQRLTEGTNAQWRPISQM